MNMGVADSVDLGWKMAAVLQGWGSQRLLDSYEAERRPAHEFVLDEAEANHGVLPNQLTRSGIEDMTAQGAQVRREIAEVIQKTKRDEFYALGVVLGYSYRGSPVVCDDGRPSTWRRSRDYVPCAEPGCLAPHTWLGDGRSLYDLFGAGFTLLALGACDGDDLQAARSEAKSTRTPLEILRLPDERLAQMYGAPRVLIRPDQHIAWRGDRWPAPGVLATVTGRGRPAKAHGEPA
jgi:hypothetical protein